MSEAEAKSLYEKIAGELTDGHTVVASQMFGMPTLKAGNGKAFAGLYRDSMTFKMAPDDLAAANRLPGAGEFDPSGMGRAMGGWVMLTLEGRAHWEQLAGLALKFVSGLPKGKK